VLNGVALATLGAVPPIVIGLRIYRHLSRGFTFGAVKQ
jgi:ABC-type glycerol-3-phosphate transport system permease component